MRIPSGIASSYPVECSSSNETVNLSSFESTSTSPESSLASPESLLFYFTRFGSFDFPDSGFGASPSALLLDLGSIFSPDARELASYTALGLTMILTKTTLRP